MKNQMIRAAALAALLLCGAPAQADDADAFDLNDAAGVDADTKARCWLMGQAFYGRSKAYLDAVSDRRALVAALTRNIYGGAPSAAAAAPRLADYIGQAIGDLKAQDRAAIIDGRPRFPDPAAVPTPNV